MILELLGLLGYIIASFAFFVFILLLLAARNNTLSGRLVLMGSLATLASFGFGALQLQQHFSLKIVFVFETVKILLWSLLVLTTRERLFSFKELFHNKNTKQFMLIWLLSSFASWWAAYHLQGGGKYLFLLFLVFNLWALVLLEQLYRNAEIKSKWALAPLVIALGAMFVFDFVLFAQASMLNKLDFDLWYLRSLIAIISVPLLLISTRRMKDWSVNVFISREVVFYSSMLMISGLYLLFMAFAGYIINYLGGEWGSKISVVFLVLGTIVLAALLITERLRREVKVFITKHFFANKYEYKDEWLKLIQQLEISQSGDYYQTALRCICSTLQIPNGLIIKKQNLGRYGVLYSEGISPDQNLFYQLENVDKFCQQNNWIIDIREFDKVENSYPDLTLDSSVFAQLKISIIVPIMIAEDLYGFFLLSSPLEQKKPLNWEDRDLLAAISKQLSHYLSLNEANEKLAEAKQFDAFNRMSAFLVHDLKNVQAQLSLINSNAKKHRNNPEFVDDAFATVASAATRLEKVLAQLRNKTVLEFKQKKASIKQILTQVAEQRNIDSPQVELSIENDIKMVIEEETFSSVINHLIQNSQEATNDNGWVNIKASYFNKRLNIAISDNGSGMSAEFIKNRLFKAFDTTKGNAGMGIGVFEAKQYIEGIGGTIQVTSFEGKGTTFHLSIPDINIVIPADS